MQRIVLCVVALIAVAALALPAVAPADSAGQNTTGQRGSGQGGTDRNADNAKQEIQARTDEFTAAWNRHDAERMAALWTEDGDVINPFGRKAEGRDQVRRLFAEEQAGPMRESRHEITVTSVRLVGDDLALVDSDSTITGIRGPDGQEHPPLKLHIFNVMKRQDGQWMIVSARPYAFLPPPDGAQHDAQRGAPSR